MPLFQLPSPVQELRDPLWEKAGVRLLVKRDDLIHPHISGNKWRKLKYNLETARGQGLETILTYGGAYSNHLAATAEAGAQFGFQAIGVVRGEEHLPLNPTLAFASSRNMRLHYVSRSDYRQKEDEEEVGKLREQFGSFFRIPEGGGNRLGVQGCREILPEVQAPFDRVCCACGTGTTLAGIIESLPEGAQAIGFSVLKGGSFLKEDINVLLEKPEQWQERWRLETNYHFGGYAKRKPELLDFVEKFEEQHSLTLDLVYTAKLFYGLFDQLKQGAFQRGETVLAIHTGGLQGNSGFLTKDAKSINHT